MKIEMSERHIHFFSRKRFSVWPDLHELRGEDIPGVQERMRSGIDVWVVQTYVFLAPLLRERGCLVTAGAEIPPGCIVVAHRDDLNNFFSGAHRAFLVGIRADRSPLAVAQAEILQNNLDVGVGQYYVPLWPQPGIVAREPSRADEVLRMAYFGRKDSLPPWLSSDDFLSGLRGLGIEFEVRNRAWNDYHDIDIALGLRIEAPTMLRQKPASKLTNAWLAGVPALLAPEPAYQALRRDALDYIEVVTPQDVLSALRALREAPALYAAMRQRASLRAPEFTAEAVAMRWTELLTGELRELHARWQAQGGHGWPRYARAMLRQKRISAAFKRAIDEELKVMGAPPPVRS